MSFHTILPEVHELMPPMVALRQHLHAHPELSEEEFDTSRLVADKLRDWGYDVHHGLAGTGVVASLRKGQSQRIVGLRADMDALPIVETSGLPYASRHSGKMHACGHDGHTAMLLAAGQCLAQSIDFDGTVRLIFQPAEEGFPGRREWSKTACFNASPAMRYSPCTIGGLPVGCFGFLPSLHGLGRYGNDPHQRPGWPRCHAPRNGRSGRRRGLSGHGIANRRRTQSAAVGHGRRWDRINSWRQQFYSGANLRRTGDHRQSAEGNHAPPVVATH